MCYLAETQTEHPGITADVEGALEHRTTVLRKEKKKIASIKGNRLLCVTYGFALLITHLLSRGAVADSINLFLCVFIHVSSHAARMHVT